MAQKETGFSVDITLSAVITSKDGNEEDVEDIGNVLKIFKDITLLNRHFKELEYFQVKQLRKIEDEGILTCFVFSSQELEDLKKALESGELAKQITEYALASGLEVSLGILPSAENVQVDILLEKKDKVFRQGATFFKKQVSEGKCDNDRKRKVTEGKADKEKTTSKKKNARADEKLSNAKSPEDINSDARGQQKQQQNPSVEQQDGHHHQQQEQPKQQQQPKGTVSGHDDVQNSPTIPDTKPEVSKVVDTCTNTRTNAGDRHQTQNMKANGGTAGSEVNIQRQVVVNIAPSFVKKSYVESVNIEVRNQERTLGCFSLFDNTDTIWDTGVMTFAPDEEALDCRIYIYYWKWMAVKTTELIGEWVPLQSSFLPIHFGSYDLEEGFCNLIFHIMENAKFYGLKDSIMKAESVFHVYHYDIRYMSTFSRTIQNYVEKRGFSLKKEAFDLLGYVFGRLRDYHKEDDFHLHQKTCTAILKSLIHLTEDDIPSKSVSYFMKIFDTLCEVAYPTRECQFFTLFEYGFPFLPVKYFSVAVDRYRQELSSLRESNFESIQTVLHRCLPENCSDAEVIDFVEKLARHVPLTIIVLSKSDLGKIIGETSFQEILEMKVKGECRRVEKKGSVADLLEIVDVLSPFEEFTESVSASIEQSFNCILGNTKPDKSTFPENMMARIINSKVIFRTTSSRKQLLILMSESKNTWLHSNFIILLKDIYNDELGSDFIAESTLKWFMVAIANHCDKSFYKKPVDDLPLVYAHLQTALSVECVSKQDHLVTQLKDKAFKFMKTVSPSALVDKVQSQDVFENSDENHIVLEHMQKYLFEDTKQSTIHSIMAKAGRSSWGYRKCTRLFATLLQTAIESADFEKSKEKSSAFLKIAKNAKLWINVIAYSKEHESLKNNKILKKTEEHCKIFGENLKQTSLSMSYAQELSVFSKENPDEVVDLLVSSGCNCTKVQLHSCLKELEESFDLAESDGEFLEVVVKNLKRNSGGAIEDLDLAHKRIKRKREELLQDSNIPVSAVLDRSHWEPFSAVLTSFQNIEQVARSESFWKICKENMPKWIATDYTGTDVSSSPEDDIYLLFGEKKEVEEGEPLVTIRVMVAISTHGVEEYENMWKPLFNKEDRVIGDIIQIVDVKDMKKEIEIAESFSNKGLPEWIRQAFALYSSYHKFLEKIKTIRKVLTILHFEAIGKTFDQSVEAFTLLSERDDIGLTLRGLYDSSKVLDSVNTIVTEELENILLELSKASQLVEFIRQTALEDLRNLIDAVEEHSEQSVKESTVSALIEVKRFLSPVIRDQEKDDVHDVLRTLQKSLTDSQITKLDQKISECNDNFHVLKVLFHNVANRGEVTKQIVKNVVQKGSRFVFTITGTKKCEMKLTYKNHGKTKTHTDSDVKDLRSRVLLLVNADAKDEAKKKRVKEEYEMFVNFVDDALDIANILSQLCLSGHPEYPIEFQRTLLTKDSKCHYNEFQEQLHEWQTTTAEMRQECYWLNFFYPEQLLKLKELLEFPSIHGEEEIRHLLSFTGCTIINISELKKIYAEEAEANAHDAYGLKTLGTALHHLFENKPFTETTFPGDKKKDGKPANFGDVVEMGDLFVAGLNENSDLVIPTLMALHKNTTGLLPKAHQVLFCEEDTCWEDIKLLLNRSLGSCNQKGTQLFTLVCIEKLPTEMQFMFMDAVKELKGEPVLFAVICRGGAHHPFLDHFGTKVHNVQHMSQQAMENCLQTLWPEVFTVMSDVPGQGKSEFIQEKAWTKGLAVSTLHLSGDLTSADMVRKIASVGISPMHVLHIDVGTLTKQQDVDLQLFQLIVLGFLRHGSTMVKLTTKYIYIEIANTISNSLRNSLKTMTSFNRQFLVWETYENYHPSQEICSPAQVVCVYLKAYDDGKLDQTDLYFTGQNVCKPLHEKQCQILLQKYFSVGSDMSFAVVNIFLNVLSDQLKKFSCSYFFRTTNIAGMLGNEANMKTVKSQLFKALLDVSSEFATRSVNACREEQSSSVKSMTTSAEQSNSNENLTATSASAHEMTKRVDGMIRWAESNHLILAFHNQDIQTLSALYREKDLVPRHIRKLFETQVKKSLPDFSNLNQEELQEILQRIARFTEGIASKEMLENIAKNYALTPDNLLKMILIVLRTRSQVPIIVMGETGCGKTSLIRYLAKVCGVHIEIQSIHAGIGESQIIQRVTSINEKALTMLSETVWLFLDEINTCNHLGLINTILCHHKCQGETLAPNLIVMAACNPYKLRSEKSIFTAGLESKVRADEKSRLVYRVNPLPERMVDYVWDYGSLNANDEISYIKRMVDGCVQSNLVDCLVDLLVMSQKVVRDREESGSCVSLRDVNRCTTLIGWFKQNLQTKHDMKNLILKNKVLERHSVVLALAHSYHSRLPDNSSRKQYRAKMEKIFSKHYIEETENSILRIIQREQSDLLERMELPPGTARNTALKENVFVIMVCILNHIPVFVVGKPGCSKSLSLQLIKSNLRGKDSKDAYFQSLPQVYCVSYQGSESSTSEGIIKVFEKAERYKDQDKDGSVLPVVVLDEIGLAETSKFNPLKVLHSLLEPGDTELPKVAVVGISNWALDAAKMNRAIHLSRPDMDADELYHTGLSISEASVHDQTMNMSLSSTLNLNETKENIDSDLIKAIADAYIDYTGKQKFKNFHGLRDFYSLVKFVSKEYHSLSDEYASDPEMQLSIVVKGLLRNFGGLSTEIDSVLSVFKTYLEATISAVDPLSWPKEMPRVLQLVEDNIRDQTARHLLLATRGESALSIIEDLLGDMGRKHVTILGSHFEEDRTDDYNYRILSQIILCMEEGVVLVLKDLESIYGSLYDMLNQNYTIVGSKKNCRIALGAYSNPLCHVHDDFRCIVLVEEDKLDISDPPFLNRFEKQFIKLSDMLSAEEKEASVELDKWMDICTDIPNFHFKRRDAIPIDSPDMIASAVKFVFTREHKHLSQAQKLQECKHTLLRACSPESVVRFELSNLHKDEVEELQEKYFTLPFHHGLESYLQKRQQETETCLKEMIFSHSNLHTDISACFAGSGTQCQIERLSAFKSEKQLCQKVNSFWFESQNQCLIMQCAMQSDKNNILLMKSIVDKCQADYVRSKLVEEKKHVVILMHMDRSELGTYFAIVNFLGGWSISFVDILERKENSIVDLLQKQKIHLIEERRPLTSFVEKHLFWAFTLIHYHDAPRDLESLKKLLHALSNDTEIMLFFEDIVMNTLQDKLSKEGSNNWQLEVACDGLKLYSHLTLCDALEHEVAICIKHPLAAFIFKLEEASALDSVTLWCEPADKTKREVWKRLSQDNSLLDYESVPQPEGPECYDVMESVLSLHCPFSRLFIEKIETLREPFMEGLAGDYPEFDIDEITEEIIEDLVSRFQESIRQAAVDMFENYNTEQFSDYVKDVCNVLFCGVKLDLSEDDRTRVTEWSVTRRLSKVGNSFEENASRLHVTTWLYGTVIESELKLISVCKSLTDTNLDDMISQQNTPFTLCSDKSEISKGSLSVIPEQTLSEDDIYEQEEDNNDSLPSKLDDEKLTEPEIDLHGHEESTLDEPILSKSEKEVDIDDIEIEDEDVQCQEEEPNMGWDDGQCIDLSTACDGDDIFKGGYINDKQFEGMEKSSGFIDVDEKQDKTVALIDFACSKLLPSQALFASLSEHDWINGIQLVLTLACEVSFEAKLCQSLRICSDFSLLIGTSKKLAREFLCRIGQALTENPPESEAIFNIVSQLVNALFDEVPCKALQHFFSCYISSALAANPDGQLLHWTFQSLPSLVLYKDTYSFFGPTLFQTLLVELGYIDVLTKEIDTEDTETLQDMESCISEYVDRGDPDSHLACLIVDVFQTHFCNMDFKLDAITLDNVLRFEKLLKTQGLSLRHLVALAYLKNFLIKFSKDLGQREPVDLNIVQKINGMLSLANSDKTPQNARTKALQMFFLKVTCQNDGLKRMVELFEDFAANLQFLAIHEVQTDERLYARELSPMETDSDIYQCTLAAYDALPDNDSQMKDVAQKSKSKPEHVQSLFGVALQRVHLLQSVRQITDSERNDKIKVFYDIVSCKLLKNQSTLFRNLCSFGDFNFRLLQARSSKPPDKHHSSVCILHLLCTILAFNPNQGNTSKKCPLLLRCLQAPRDLHKLYIPGSGFKESAIHKSTLLAISERRKYQTCSCSCNEKKVIELESDLDDMNCDKCKQTFKKDGETFQISSDRHDSPGLQGYHFVEIGCLHGEFLTVRKLSQAAFRILQFILHGCLAGSLALEFADATDVSQALALPESVDPESYLTKHLEIHWSAIKSLTEMGDAQLAKLINFIISDKILNMTQDNVPFDRIEEQKSFEIDFTNYINGVMHERFQIIQNDVAKYQSHHMTSTASKFEVMLTEQLPSDDRLGDLPRLFMEHVEPSLENMQREFCLQEQVRDYPLMALLFEKKEDIALLRHLVPLMKWHKLVIRYGSHKLSKADCKQQNVQDFVRTSVKGSTGDHKELDSFKMSWNELTEKQHLLRFYNPKLQEMERIHKLVTLDKCVIMTKQSTLMQVLVALKSIQNGFLKDALIICLSTQSLSVSFLKQSEGVAVIPEVSLEHVQKKQVIAHPDLTAALKFSQICTELGHGRERQYDMHKIEGKVLINCVMNKPLIRISSSFPMISFYGESLYKTDELFKSMMKIVGHELLDKDQKDSIEQLREKSSSNMQTLLDYLQMTFSLLKRAPVSGSDKNQYLSEFLETWQSLFPYRVQEVDRLCQKVRLSQILSLYGHVEDKVADDIFDGLEDKFRTPLPGQCLTHMNELVSNSLLTFQEALTSALKKIVFRYLQTGHASCDDKLSPLLIERSLWPHGVLDEAVSKSSNPSAGLLHELQMVEHIHGTVIFLVEAIEEKKRRDERKPTLCSHPVTRQTNKAQRKRRAVKFDRI